MSTVSSRSKSFIIFPLRYNRFAYANGLEYASANAMLDHAPISEMFTLIKPKHCPNAFASTLTMDGGTVTPVSFPQSKNAALPIFTTGRPLSFDGMTISPVVDFGTAVRYVPLSSTAPNDTSSFSTVYVHVIPFTTSVSAKVDNAAHRIRIAVLSFIFLFLMALPSTVTIPLCI